MMGRHSIVEFESLSDVPRDAWRSIGSRTSVFQSYHWFRNFESKRKMRFIATIRKGRISTLLPVCVINEPGHYYHSPDSLFSGANELEWIQAAASRFAKNEFYPALVATSPYGYRGGVIECGRTAPRKNELSELAEYFSRLARRLGTKLALSYYLNENDDSNWIDALADAGSQVIVQGADANLLVNWPSLDAYFSALGRRGRKLQTQYNKLLNDRTVVWKIYPAPFYRSDPKRLEEAASLFDLHAKTRDRTRPSKTDIMSLLCDSCVDGLLLAGLASDSGKMQSGLFCLRKGDTLYPKFYGDRGVRDHYFMLVYPILVDYALKSGCRRIEYGGGSHRAKILRGARLRYLYGAVSYYDENALSGFTEFLSLYSSAKEKYFSTLWERYGYQVREPLVVTKPRRLSHACEKQIPQASSMKRGYTRPANR